MTQGLRRVRRRSAGWLALGLSTALALAACGGGADEDTAPAQQPESVGQADIDEAMQTPTELTFWTWVPDIEKEVALFEEAYPAIDVTVVNARGSRSTPNCARRCRPAPVPPTSCRSSSSTSRRSR